MQMELRGFMHEMILTELEDAVGVENVSHSSDQKLAYGTDYFWLACWQEHIQTRCPLFSHHKPELGVWQSFVLPSQKHHYVSL